MYLSRVVYFIHSRDGSSRRNVDVYISTRHVVRNTDGSHVKNGESARLDHRSTSTQQRDGCSDILTKSHRRRLRTVSAIVVCGTSSRVWNDKQNDRSMRCRKTECRHRLRPEIRRDYPLNLSILISGGKETNRDCPSNGE